MFNFITEINPKLNPNILLSDTVYNMFEYFWLIAWRDIRTKKSLKEKQKTRANARNSMHLQREKMKGDNKLITKEKQHLFPTQFQFLAAQRKCLIADLKSWPNFSKKKIKFRKLVDRFFAFVNFNMPLANGWGYSSINSPNLCMSAVLVVNPFSFYSLPNFKVQS